MRTKIVCTIGPATKSKTKIKRLIQSGMTVARINFSHGSHESNGEIIKNIRHAASELKANVALMIDLQGPRIRVASVQKPITLSDKEKVFLYESRAGKFNPGRREGTPIGIDSKGMLKYLKKGNPVYIDNGMIELEVLKKGSGFLTCGVKVPGTVGVNKGVNIPGISSKMKAFTKRDRENLKFGLKKDADFIAMSFVKSRKDIVFLKKTIKKMLPGIGANELPGIVAKIETKSAVENFDEILKEVDAIMIARGDLAIELPPERIPALQKEMTRKCLHNARPVIVATQMLESMMQKPRPTRAEITDVANAVIDHADALMLSGETAMGKYPVKSITMMAKIIKNTEAGPYDDLNFRKIALKELVPFSIIARAAANLAKEMELKSIIIRDAPPVMAYKVSRYRPEVNIVYLTKDAYVKRKMALVWGLRVKKTYAKPKGGYVLIEGAATGHGTLEYRIKRGK